MLLDLHARLKDVLRSTIRAQWNIEPPDVILNQTPKVELGELAMQKLLALLAERPVEDAVLQPSLVVRASTAPPRLP